MTPRDESRLTSREVADRLGVRLETVYAYVSRGVLTSRRAPAGRGSTFDRAEVEACWTGSGGDGRGVPRGRPRGAGPVGRHGHHPDRGRPALLPRCRRRRPRPAPATSSGRPSGCGPARRRPTRFVAPAEPLAAARAAVAALPASADLVSPAAGRGRRGRAPPTRCATTPGAPRCCTPHGGCSPRWSRPSPAGRPGHRRPRRGRRPAGRPAVGPAHRAGHLTRDCCGAWTPRWCCWSTTTWPSRRSPCAPPRRCGRTPTPWSPPGWRRWRGRCTAPPARWRTTSCTGAWTATRGWSWPSTCGPGGRCPGFGHRLYPDGDPRAAMLLDLLAGEPAAAAAVAAVQQLAAASGQRPNVDLALAALAARRRDAARRGRGGLLRRPVGRVGRARPGGVRRAAAAVPRAGRLPRPPATAATSVVTG